MEYVQRGKVNTFLRQQRLQRGWSLQHVADQLCKLCEDEERVPGVNADMIGKWERGEKKPSPFYREKFCALYNASADMLGFIEVQNKVEQSVSVRSAPSLTTDTLSAFSSIIFPLSTSISTQMIDAVLSKEKEELHDLLIANLLSLSSRQLATLTTVGWTQQDIINALQVTLQGDSGMMKISRRRALQLGAGVALSGIPLTLHEHPSIEERTQLTKALSESIAASWTLFHTSGPAQTQIVGQSQLYIVQQANTLLYPSVQAMFYSAAYRLIGASLHFQGRYDEAYTAHEKAYIVALECASIWDMAQSRSWQAYGSKAKGNYADALQVADTALRLISQNNDRESIRLRARLLAFGAENAALLGDTGRAQSRLSASEELLEQLPGYHEEFDRISWLQEAGICALHLGQYDTALQQLQQALDELPHQWGLRFVSTALPLSNTLIKMNELDEALTITRKVLPVVQSTRSTALTQDFMDHLQGNLLMRFPHEQRRQAFVVEAQRQLAIA